MAIFNSFLYVHQRVFRILIAVRHVDGISHSRLTTARSARLLWDWWEQPGYSLLFAPFATRLEGAQGPHRDHGLTMADYLFNWGDFTNSDRLYTYTTCIYLYLVIFGQPLLKWNPPYLYCCNKLKGYKCRDHGHVLSVRRQVPRQERNPQVVVITEHSLLDHPELQANTRVQVANLSDALRVYPLVN